MSLYPNDETLAFFAKQAKIILTEEIKSQVKKNIYTVLDYVSILDSVDIENVEPIYTPLELYDRNMWAKSREDIPVITAYSKQAVLSNAPERKLDFFVIPKVLDHE